MAVSRNDSKNNDTSFVELKDVSDGLTGQALILHSHANGQETQVNTEDICDAEKHERMKHD